MIHESPIARLVACCFLASGTVLPAQLSPENLNPGWRLGFGDLWNAGSPDSDDPPRARVTLPRPWNEDDAFRVDIRQLPAGTVEIEFHEPAP
jgi:beta-galactosidase